MRKQLFETKVKDGLWLIGIVGVVIVTSLSMDDVAGWTRRGKIKAVLYVPSYEVPSDGPALKAGDGVKLYKQIVGRVLDVKFFVAAVQKPVDVEFTPPPETAPSPSRDPFGTEPAASASPGASPVAPSSPAAPATPAASPAPAPSPTAASAPAPAPASRPELVSGLKIAVELYKGDFAHILALVTPESTVKVESQTLGESSVMILTSAQGRPVTGGDRINFPRNHVSLVKVDDESTRWGRELTSEAEVVAVREQIKALSPRHVPAEPKKDPRDEF